MTDPHAPKPEQNQKPPKTKSVKSAKDGVTWEELFTHFSFDKLLRLSEQQVMVMMVVAVIAGYLIYDYLSVPVEQLAYDPGLGAVLQQAPVETAEEKFKRENKNAVLPDGSQIARDFVERQTRLERNIPFGDKQMEFVVRLPNDWVMSNFARYGLPGQETYTILTNIARYFGPAIEDARPFFWLEVQKLNRFITAESYARAYMLKVGIVPEALNPKSDARAESLYVDVRDGRSYAMRTIFQMAGPYVVMASVGVPIQSYGDYKDMLGLVINSFALVDPPKGTIEDIIDYKLLNVLRFQYYKSWLPRNEVTQTALRPSLELHNPQEVKNPDGKLLQGIILVNAYRLSTAFKDQDPYNDIKDRLQELGMVLLEDQASETDAPQVENLSPRDGYTNILQRRYKALVKRYIRKDEFDIVKSEETKTRQEVWVTVLDNGYYKTYLTLISPLRETNYVIWAQNKAAYDLLLRSVQTREAPKNE